MLNIMLIVLLERVNKRDWKAFGEFSTVDPTLARLIGRPPMTLQDVVKTTLQMEK